jgi:hypothetical protein
VGLAKWFLRSYAIREVLDGYSPPGQRKRTPATKQSRPPPLYLDAELSEEGKTVGDVLAESDRYTDETDLCDVVLARSALVRAAKTAPPFVARALWLIYVDGVSLNAAAREVSVDRTTLARALRRWAVDEGLREEPDERVGSKLVASGIDSPNEGGPKKPGVPANSRPRLVRVA